MRYGIRCVLPEAKENDRVHDKPVDKDRTGKGRGTLPEKYKSHADRSGVHDRVFIHIEPERLLQGLFARYSRRDTKKSMGNKELHTMKNRM